MQKKPMKIDQVICLKGSLPSSQFLQELSLPIIACDGAYDIVPYADYIIGDIDSIKSQHSVKFNKISCQHCTDFEKALSLFHNKTTLVCGLEGGEIDHVLNNIHVFSLYSKWQRLIGFSDHALGNKIIISSRHYVEFSLPKGHKVSLFGLPSCEVSTTGLKWDIKNHLLTVEGKSGARNESLYEHIRIDVHSGTLLVTIDINDLLMFLDQLNFS